MTNLAQALDINADPVRNRLKDRGMGHSLRKIIGFLVGRTPPRQPDYADELSAEQLEAIRKLAGCESLDNYTALHAPAW